MHVANHKTTKQDRHQIPPSLTHPHLPSTTHRLPRTSHQHSCRDCFVFSAARSARCVSGYRLPSLMPSSSPPTASLLRLLGPPSSHHLLFHICMSIRTVVGRREDLLVSSFPPCLVPLSPIIPLRCAIISSSLPHLSSVLLPRLCFIYRITVFLPLSLRRLWRLLATFIPSSWSGSAHSYSDNGTSRDHGSYPLPRGTHCTPIPGSDS